MRLRRPVLVGAFAGTLSLALIPSAHADQSVTAFPNRIYTEGKSHVTITVMDTGTEPETIQVSSVAPWLAVKKPRLLDLQPGEQHEVRVNVLGSGTEGGVLFTMQSNDPTASGVAATGGVEVPIISGASPAPPTIAKPDGGWVSWPMLALVLLAVALAVGSVLGRKGQLKRRGGPRSYGF